MTFFESNGSPSLTMKVNYLHPERRRGILFLL
jgi:hypothetical protein